MAVQITSLPAMSEPHHESAQTVYADQNVVVSLPTSTVPSFEQKVVGRLSPLSPKIEEFRGIPYGIVPARWQHSVLRTKLPDDVFDASRNGPKCTQPEGPNNTIFYQSHLEFPQDVGLSEKECLNLVVVRPSIAAVDQTGYDARKGLPVFFYIHGGGFGFGAGTDPMWDPNRLVLQSLAIKAPIMVVMINYRLNIFGFAASADIIASQPSSAFKGCNFGLYDQKIALKWVSQNISAFGGDPARIVIGGQSAGSISVHAQLLDAKFNAEPPLFQKAIMQSGAFQTAGPIPLSTAEQHWTALCETLAVPSGYSATKRVEFIQNVSAEELLKVAEEKGWMIFPIVADEMTITSGPQRTWKAKFQGDAIAGHPAVPAVAYSPIEILIGDADTEGSISERNISRIQSFEEVQQIFEDAFGSQSDSAALLNSYRIVPGAPLPVLHERLIQFVTDIMFGYPTDRARRALSSLSNEHQPPSAKAYPTSTIPFRFRCGNPFPGPAYDVAHHCIDLIYLFDCFHEDLVKTGVSNLVLSQQVQTDWINFISGNKISASENMAFVYDHDKVARVKDLRTDEEWLDRKTRFSLLDQDFEKAVVAWKALTRTPLV